MRNAVATIAAVAALILIAKVVAPNPQMAGPESAQAPIPVQNAMSVYGIDAGHAHMKNLQLQLAPLP
jgi:hypothetical protein